MREQEQDRSTIDSAVGSAVILLLLGGALAIFYYSSIVAGILFGALAFLLMAVLRLDLALLWAIATAPFYVREAANPFQPKSFDQLNLSLLGRSLGGSGESYSTGELTILFCIAAAVIRLVMLALQGKLHLREWLCYRRKWFDIPALAIIGTALLSLIVASHSVTSLRELRLVILEPFALYIMLSTIYIPRGIGGARTLVTTLIALGAAMGIYSIYHYRFIHEVERAGGVERILAIYHSPNQLALFLDRIIPLALALVALAPGRLPRLLAAAALVPMLVAWFYTYSLGGWLGLGAAIVVILALISWRWLVAGGLALAGGLAILLIWDPLHRITDRFNLSYGTNEMRIYIWQSALAMIRDYPIFGVGLDRFLYVYPKYMLPQAALEPNLSHPHNLVLDFWLRLGIMGLLAALTLLGAFFYTGIRLVRIFQQMPQDISVRWGRAIAVALIASMAGFVAHGMIDNSFFLIDLAVVFWVSLTAMAALAARQTLEG